MMSATDEYNREQYVEELKEDCANYSKAMVEAERRANKLEKEAESLRNQVAALHDAMRFEWKDLLARAEKAEAERDKNKGCCVELREIAESIQDPRLHNTITIAEWCKEIQADRDAHKSMREKAESNYRFMVERAADQSLDGYRELAAKCAALEERAEKAEAEHYECARAEAERLRDAEAELHEIAGALPGVAYMDPPDGGSPSIAEQVRRMRADLDRTAAEVEQMRADAERWRAVSAMMTHEHRADAVGWTLGALLPGDDPDAAADAVIAARAGGEHAS